MRVTVIIPCKNEELTIGKILYEFKHKFPDYECLVIDNNSTDETARVASEGGQKLYQR